MTEYPDVERRDLELGKALRELPVPDTNPEFWSGLHVRLTAAALVPEDEAAGPEEAHGVSPHRSSIEDANVHILFQREQNETMNTQTSERPELIEIENGSGQKERPSWMIGIAASVVLIAGVVGFQAFVKTDETITVIVDSADEAPSGVDPTIAVPTTDSSNPTAPTLDEAVLGGLAYPSEWDLETGSIQLKDGKWEGEPADGAGSTFDVVTLTEHVGSEDGNSALVVLAGHGGGSGTFYDLYLITERADGTVQVSQPVLLGDRITFNTLTFDGSMVDAIYTDGFGEKFDRQFEVVDGELS